MSLAALSSMSRQQARCGRTPDDAPANRCHQTIAQRRRQATTMTSRARTLTHRYQLPTYVAHRSVTAVVFRLSCVSSSSSSSCSHTYQRLRRTHKLMLADHTPPQLQRYQLTSQHWDTNPQRRHHTTCTAAVGPQLLAQVWRPAFQSWGVVVDC